MAGSIAERLSVPARSVPRLTSWRVGIFPLAMTAAIALGVAVRASFVLSGDFPLNDGGLFYLMAQEVERNNFGLPLFTAYNAAGIPFAYSPLGFYVAAVLDQFTPLTLVDVFRSVPLAATSLTLVAFAFLARRFIASRAALLAAMLAFALVPRSFTWLIMGGGLTRSLGFLFAILAIVSAHYMYTERRGRYVLATALFCSLTVLTHLGTVPFTAFSIAIFFLAFGRHRFGIQSSAIVVVATVLVTAPWWASVAAHHGFGPFLAASGTGGSVFGDEESRTEAVSALARFGLGTGEPLFPLIGTLALLGAFISFNRARLVLPAWWLAILLFEARAGATYSTLPMGMLAGIGLVEVLLPLLHHAWPSGGGGDGGDAWEAAATTAEEVQSAAGPGRWIAQTFGRRLPPGVARSALSLIILAFFLAYSTVSALARTPDIGNEARYLVALTPEERTAMGWVASNTPPDARFVVMTGGYAGGWGSDRTAEWFPVLAQRASVATVQGYEWLPNHAFAKQERLYNELQTCGDWFVSCLGEWARRNRVSFSYLYIPRSPGPQCCRVLLRSLAGAPAWERIYDGPGAVIYRRL